METIIKFDKVTIYRYTRKDGEGKYKDYYKVKFSSEGKFEGIMARNVMYLIDEFTTLEKAKAFIRGCQFKGVVEIEGE